MDPNLLKNLGLDSSLNQNDMLLLNQILSSMGPGGNKKAPKMSAKDRNNLIAKLSSNNTLNETPKKELKDMNEQEKKIYREELKKKLKNKQNELKTGRTSNLAKQKITNEPDFTQAIGKLSEMMKNIDPSALESLNLNPSNELNQSEQQNNVSEQQNNVSEQQNNVSEQQNNVSEQQNNVSEQQNNAKQEILINNISNQSNKDETTSIEPENLDDYLN